MSSAKTRKIYTLAKLFQAMRCRTRHVTMWETMGDEEFSESVPNFLNYAQ